MSYSTSLRIGGQEFQLRLGLTIAAAIVILVCTALGIWQLHRAADKASLASLLSQRVAQSAVPLDRVDFERNDAWRYAQVAVRGRYDTARQFYIPHRLHQGQQGTHVITPLRLSDQNRVILVNRGWIPSLSSTDAMAHLAVGPREQTITGRLVNPAAPALRLGPPNSDPTPWQRDWLYADPTLFGTRSGTDALPMVLLLDADMPEGFARDWVLPQPDPSMHYGYAIQWFAFALIALIVWASLSRKRGELQ